jgi:hypothetical protein
VGLSGCQNCGGKSKDTGPTDTTTRGTGSITVNGVAKEYTVKADDSHFYLLVKKGSGSQCSFFHHHAVAALGTVFEFNLDRASPDTSHFNLTTSPAGLDLDKAEWRNVFPETAGSTFTDSERSDSRANMNEQLDSASFGTLTFNARNLTTLDGTGTAPVDVTIKGSTSTITLNATATWAGDQLTITGTGSVDGHNHSMPVGTFKDCIDPNLGLDLRLVLIPGSSGNQMLPDGGPAFMHTTYPETVACGAVGWQSVERSLAVRCGGCHSNPTTQGATIPLVTFEDYRINTPLFPNGPIYQDLPSRLGAADGRRMPPNTSTQMPQAEMDKVLAWVNGGGALHECDADGGVKDLADAGPLVAQDAGPPPVCGTLGYDVDIAPLMNRHCVSCHNAAGGSVSLDTYASGFVATSATAYRPLNRWQSSAARVADHSMWPNAPTNATTDMLATTLNAWVAENLPQGKCDGDGGIVTPPDAGPLVQVDAGPPPACGAVGYGDVQATLTNYCTSCHSTGGTRSQAPLDSYNAGFATSPPPYQTMNLWQAAGLRIGDRTMPVGVNVPQAQIDAFTQWVGLNMPFNNCSSGGPTDAGPVMPTCNSNNFAPNDPNNGGDFMMPGQACNACHQTQQGGIEPPPLFTIAGTVMGLLHDQDLCISPLANGITNVKIHVVPAVGAPFDVRVGTTADPTANNGNFLSERGVTSPFHVSLVYTRNGTVEERPMSASPSEVQGAPAGIDPGDCNVCHTVMGTNGAPGRITPFP